MRASVVFANVYGIPGNFLSTGATIQSPSPTPEATPAATPEPSPTPSATPPAPPAPRPAFTMYQIQPGDTISSIAAAFGVDQKYILWNNADVSSEPDMLAIGQELLIPSVNGIVYHVTLGDTLTDIVAYYKIDVQSVIDFAPNNLASPDSLAEKAVLVLPGAVPPPPVIRAAAPAVAAAPQPAPGPAAAVPAPAPRATAAPAPPPPPPPPAPSRGYIWPFSGSISSYYGEYRGGGSYHQALDIDGFGRNGAPVVAAASGTVALATSGGGYGNYIIIQHPNGSRTLYAHLAFISVSVGQSVGQGQMIGGVGSTGYSTGTHLHFELHINGVPVDPLQYLP